jgi:hypothetical protein
MNAPTAMLSAALEYAAHGWPVFPLYGIRAGRCTCSRPTCDRAGKHPCTANGLNDASTDPVTIREWWRKWPDANIGAVTGERSGFVALDEDPRHGGDGSLIALLDEAGLHETVVSRTGGGGQHALFAYPGRTVRNRTAIRQGLDFRGDGGYIVLPPSLHASGGRYEWLPGHRFGEVPLAQMPERLLSAIGPPARDARSHAAQAGTIAAGTRNATLASLAGTMRRRGMTEAEILPALMVANDQRCEPPLEVEEVSGIAASVARYAPVSSEPVHGAETKPVSLSAGSRVVAPPAAAYEPFPVKQLPPGCRRFVNEAARARGLDPAYIAVPMLGALAGAIGNSRRLRVKASYAEPAVLWTALVARSGVGKSSPLDDLLGPLWEEDRRLAEENAAAAEDYSRALARHEADRADFRRGRKNNPTLAEPLRPAPPPQRALVVEDPTVEALAERLRDNPRGLLLARDELSGWIGGFDAYKNARGADVAHYLSMHRAGPLKVDRKDRYRPTIAVQRAALSVVGTVQPRVLRRVVRGEHRENGLLARLFVAMPPELPVRWTEDDVSPEAYAIYRAVVKNLLNGLDGEQAELKLDREARARYAAFNDEFAHEATEEDDDLFAAMAKLRGGALRLALIIALARAAEEGRATCLPEVDVQDVEAGIALARWFGREARRVYAVLGETPEEREDLQLVNAIQERGGHVTAGQLAHGGPRRFRGNPHGAEVALMRLAKVGLGRWEESPSTESGGRPTRILVLVDRVQPGAITPDSPQEGAGNVSAPALETGSNAAPSDRLPATHTDLLRFDWESAVVTPCRGCGGTRFWLHRDAGPDGGDFKCVRCHPAPIEDVVGRWIEASG